MSSDKCKKGQHPLIVIHRAGSLYNECAVTRWCPECGAVVVDVDYDGRTNAGQIMKMRIPKVSRS